MYIRAARDDVPVSPREHDYLVLCQLYRFAADQVGVAGAFQNEVKGNHVARTRQDHRQHRVARKLLEDPRRLRGDPEEHSSRYPNGTEDVPQTVDLGRRSGEVARLAGLHQIHTLLRAGNRVGHVLTPESLSNL